MKLDKYILCSIFILYLGISEKSFAQIRYKQPKISLELSSGYDSNLLRVASSSDSNRVSAPAENAAGRVNWWLYWTKNLRSYFSGNAEYTYFLGSGYANTWDLQTTFKTIAGLHKRKKGSWIPGLKMNVKLEYDLADKFYGDRALGDEYLVNLNGTGNTSLNLGDLFDKQVFVISGGLDFEIASGFGLFVEAAHNIRDYKNIGNGSAIVYSLDNKENEIAAGLVISPLQGLKINLSADRTLRRYEYKRAVDLQKNANFQNNREYLYKGYGIDLEYDWKRFEGKLWFDRKLRDDQYEGLYSYELNRFKTRLSYRFLQELQTRLEYQIMSKEYSNLTLYGVLLNNDYYTFTAITEYRFSSLFSVSSIYIFDKELSTYQKFSYNRHIMMFRIRYNLFD